MAAPDGDDPRIFLAAERTLLAWVRTGLAIAAFGFVVARFGLSIRRGVEDAGAAERAGPMVLGGLLVLAGSAALPAASLRFARFVRSLRESGGAVPYAIGPAVAIPIGLAALGVLLAGLILSEALRA